MVQIVDIEVSDTILYTVKMRDTSKILPCTCREGCTGKTSVLHCKLYGIVPMTFLVTVDYDTSNSLVSSGSYHEIQWARCENYGAHVLFVAHLLGEFLGTMFLYMTLGFT